VEKENKKGANGHVIKGRWQQRERNGSASEVCVLFSQIVMHLHTKTWVLLGCSVVRRFVVALWGEGEIALDPVLLRLAPKAATRRATPCPSQCSNSAVILQINLLSPIKIHMGGIPCGRFLNTSARNASSQRVHQFDSGIKRCWSGELAFSQLPISTVCKSR